MRQEVKEHIADLNEKYPEVYEHLAAAHAAPTNKNYGRISQTQNHG